MPEERQDINPFRVLGQPPRTDLEPAVRAVSGSQEQLDAAVQEEAERGLLFTTVGGMVNWAVNQARANAIWPPRPERLIHEIMKLQEKILASPVEVGTLTFQPPAGKKKKKGAA